ncbi:MAG TPA: hypothetical protein PK129_06755 [Cellvibrionaceae bacterium]|nr:hypothetical protein [Cellvibrionaceae bacterium]
MPTVLRQDFRTRIIKAGAYTNPNAATMVVGGNVVNAPDNNSPLLQGANGVAMVPGGVGGVGAHYRQPLGIKFSLQMGVDPISGGRVALFRPRGDHEQAAYLPYCDNYICSLILPPNGVDYFFTDNLSGCAIYIDQVHGSRDLVVYHANARATQSGPGGDPAATLLMDNMHNAAMGQYNGWLGNMLIGAATLYKAQYFGGAINHYTQRKTNEGRQNVQTLGVGTNVMGFKRNNRWEFWYQTWALASYDRPDNSWGKMTKGASQQAVYGQGKILRSEMFWRQP